MLNSSTGQLATDFNRAVSISLPVSALIQGESISPNPVTLNQGVGQVQVTLLVIDSSPGNSCCRTYALNSSLVTQAVGFINVWFDVQATVEFYANCDGTLSYGAQTSCSTTAYPANSKFVALPFREPCGTTVMIRDLDNNSSNTAPFDDVGPMTTTDSYWTTSGIPQNPDHAIDLSDGFASLLGISYGCNNGFGFGGANVLWRFK